jgi:hypothetical protein
MIVECCVCHRIRKEQTWLRRVKTAPEAAAGESVSHGYCPACARKAFAEIRRARRRAAFQKAIRPVPA